MPYAASESVEAQAAKLQGLLQSAATAIVIIDTAGTIENVNPATARMFGYETSELVGKNVKVLMPEPYRTEHDGYLANYLSSGIKKIIGIGREVSGRRKDSHCRLLSVRCRTSRFPTSTMSITGGPRFIDRTVCGAGRKNFGHLTIRRPKSL